MFLAESHPNIAALSFEIVALVALATVLYRYHHKRS